MEQQHNRLSTLSSLSLPLSAAGVQQASSSSLLNALHAAYAAGQPYGLESSCSVVLNTWATAASRGPDGRYGGTVDLDLGRKAWEHARRRAEDGCIILG